MDWPSEKKRRKERSECSFEHCNVSMSPFAKIPIRWWPLISLGIKRVAGEDVRGHERARLENLTAFPSTSLAFKESSECVGAYSRLEPHRSSYHILLLRLRSSRAMVLFHPCASSSIFRSASTCLLLSLSACFASTPSPQPNLPTTCCGTLNSRARAERVHFVGSLRRRDCSRVIWSAESRVVAVVDGPRRVEGRRCWFSIE